MKPADRATFVRLAKDADEGAWANYPRGEPSEAPHWSLEEWHGQLILAARPAGPLLMSGGGPSARQPWMRPQVSVTQFPAICVRMIPYRPRGEQWKRGDKSAASKRASILGAVYFYYVGIQ